MTVAVAMSPVMLVVVLYIPKNFSGMMIRTIPSAGMPTLFCFDPQATTLSSCGAKLHWSTILNRENIGHFEMGPF